MAVSVWSVNFCPGGQANTQKSNPRARHHLERILGRLTSSKCNLYRGNNGQPALCCQYYLCKRSFTEEKVSWSLFKVFYTTFGKSLWNTQRSYYIFLYYMLCLEGLESSEALSEWSFVLELLWYPFWLPNHKSWRSSCAWSGDGSMWCSFQLCYILWKLSVFTCHKMFLVWHIRNKKTFYALSTCINQADFNIQR